MDMHFNFFKCTSICELYLLSKTSIQYGVSVVVWVSLESDRLVGICYRPSVLKELLLHSPCMFKCNCGKHHFENTPFPPFPYVCLQIEGFNKMKNKKQTHEFLNLLAIAFTQARFISHKCRASPHRECTESFS